MNRFWFGFIVVLFFLVACADDHATPITDADTIITDWLDSSGTVATRDESGIYYYSISQNPAGALVSEGSILGIYYTLNDLNDNQLASHQRNNGDSLILKQGVSAVFPVGLDIGLSFMRQGETFGMVLPPSLGYGQVNSGNIAPDLIALLEVEVASVTDETDIFVQESTHINDYIVAEDLNDLMTNPLDPVLRFTSGVAYKRIASGTGTLPLNGDPIVLNYTGRFLTHAPFSSRTELEFVFGSGLPRPLIPGLEFGVSLMQIGERSLVIVPSSQAYRESALIVPAHLTGFLIEESIIPDYVSSVPAYRTLIFDVTRVD